MERYNTNKDSGLSIKEVNKRINEGLVNYNDQPKTKSIPKILASNFFTYFNFLNLALGIAILIAGILSNDILNSLKNCLFMGVIIINSIISSIEEIISKKITDKLSIINNAKVKIIREGKIIEANLEDIVLDDLIELTSGDEVITDSIILDGEAEVNESAITGEQDSISKKTGDILLSGSYIISGKVRAKVEHIGKDNYVAVISKEAKEIKKDNSLIMDSFEKLLKVLSIALIPIGIIMFKTQMIANYNNLQKSLFATVAALIGMIPEGLILLTSSVMAVSVIRLSKYKVLVQKLYCIETLARVNVICLDKTGTLTKGEMNVKKVIKYKNIDENKFKEIITDYALLSKDNNQTIKCIKNKFTGTTNNELIDFIPFSSDRKFSAMKTKNGIYYMGAPEILFKNNLEEIKEIIEKYEQDYRIVAIAKSNFSLSKNPTNLELLGFIIIEDILRNEAKDMLEYFDKQGVDTKIISGDNVKTVLGIARRLNINNLKGIDLSSLSDEEIKEASLKYNVFGRVKPKQKKIIIKALKDAGKTVAMTGDGVNDVLALKESDCSISVSSGSDAARNVSKLILLNDNFSSLPIIVEEGRKTINNIERSASLLLVKTIYTLLLILFSIIISSTYFFIPIQLTLITTFTIGIPSFILALEPNHDLVKGNFLLKVLARALPVAITVVFNIVLVTAFCTTFNLPKDYINSLSVFVTGVTGLIYLYKICTPFTYLRATLFILMVLGFSYCFFFQRTLFDITTITKSTFLIGFVLAIDSLYIYRILNLFISYLFHFVDKTIVIDR